MRSFIDALRAKSASSKSGRIAGIGSAIALLSLAGAIGQSPAPQPENPPVQSSPSVPTTPSATPTEVPAPALTDSANNQGIIKPSAVQKSADKNPTLSAGSFSIPTIGGEIKDEQLRQMLIGKTLYLRSGYQDNNLEFDEQGLLTGHSAQGSFTLSQIQINKVKLSKHKLELEGDRYGLHFLGAAPYEDPTKATDRVKITPRKKIVRISFDREQVEIPKKKKEKHKGNQKDDDRTSGSVNQAKQPAAETAANDPSEPAADSTRKSMDIPADNRSNGKRVTTTTSPAHASQLLLTALDKVFSQGIDDRMVSAMPDFWKLYYQAAAAKADIKPIGASIFNENSVDQKAKLISVVDPPSNEFAQANGVAGIAMYHALIGADGKVEAVIAGRPIGFGLDENAEQTIRKATFQPALKDGKPVPVALDLVVSFRIYSKRTSAAAPQEVAQEMPNKTAALPGPYTLQDEEAARAAQQIQSTQSPQASPPPQ